MLCYTTRVTIARYAYGTAEELAATPSHILEGDAEFLAGIQLDGPDAFTLQDAQHAVALELNRRHGAASEQADVVGATLEMADLGREVTAHHRGLLTHLPQPEQPSENWLRQARVDAEVRGDSTEADRLTGEIVKLTQTGPFFPADAVAPF